jgi:phage gpG-like protein
MSLTVTVTDTGVSLALQRMSARLRDMTPVFAAIGSRLERNVHMRFDTKTAPSGRPWAAWSPETADERARSGRGTLLEYTGRMRDSLTYQASATGVEVGFGVDYAQYHEQLTPAGKGALPKRAMLFDDGKLSDADLNDAMKAALSAFRKQLRLQTP